MMGSSSRPLLALALPFLLCLPFSSAAPPDPNYQSFLNCLSLRSPPSTDLSKLVFTSDASSFPSLLQSSIRNLRFVGPSTRQPLVIISPADDSHVSASVLCCRDHRLPIRIRSGGHDYEGLSYRAADNRPFAILDLAGFRSVHLDAEAGTAWVQSGATLGELYYKIGRQSGVHGFPAGICPTVGVGGHLSGGGFGTMLRKYGLAADNVLDAKLVDVDGRVLDRASMGEDLFWAIRGGGGASFGVILSWKVSLVPVPSTVSVFTIHRSLSQGAVELVNKWQYIAHKLNEELFIRVVLQNNGEGTGVEAEFSSLFLGNCAELIKLLDEKFPELGFDRSQCQEMSWVQSTVYFAGYDSMEALLDRGQPERFFKAKSDYVTDPIPGEVFERIWGRFTEEEAGVLIMDPYGGRMSSIPESETPFPHREGNLFNLQYFVEWRDRGEDASRKRMDWIAKLYEDLTPYVSREPRASYLNYRDLDLGVNVEDGNTTSFSKAMAWGFKYFKKENFVRLARVKARVDPADFFRNEQSIPPLISGRGDTEGTGSVASGTESSARRHCTIIGGFFCNFFLLF